MKTEILKETENWVSGAMAGNDPAHDGMHVQRVVRLTRQLCESYPQINAYRAELLAWLHDMNDDKLFSNVGEESIARFLREIGAEEEELRFVADGIPFISYRKHPEPDPQLPIEVRIVQDADRIDAIGAIGIARTFAYGGAKQRALDESLAHFDEKLLKLYDRLNTAEAKRLAKPRYDFLRAFYAQYQAEKSM